MCIACLLFFLSILHKSLFKQLRRATMVLSENLLPLVDAGPFPMAPLPIPLQNSACSFRRRRRRSCTCDSMRCSGLASSSLPMRIRYPRISLVGFPRILCRFPLDILFCSWGIRLVRREGSRYCLGTCRNQGRQNRNE